MVLTVWSSLGDVEIPTDGQFADPKENKKWSRHYQRTIRRSMLQKILHDQTIAVETFG
jgi:hypothetical protein